MIRDDATFRPWGSLSAVFSNAPRDNWSCIGAISTEERSTALFEKFCEDYQFERTMFFKLVPSHSWHVNQATELTNRNCDKIIDLGLEEEDILPHNLDAPFGDYSVGIDRFLEELEFDNLIVDITAMPKRLFFYIIKKILLPETRISNIVVTYTEPRDYGVGALAENPRAWAALPSFLGPRRVPAENKIVIGIGYEPLGLPELVSTGEFEGSQISLLFPFPSQPDRVAKNWKFARDLFPNIDTDVVSISRVDGTNVPEIFDAIGRVGDYGDIQLMLAPFGPKPVSLAMALYASKYSNGDLSTSVFYTQPTVYNPNYSLGVKEIDGVPVINSYCIRMNGVNNY